MEAHKTLTNFDTELQRRKELTQQKLEQEIDNQTTRNDFKDEKMELDDLTNDFDSLDR